MTKSKMKMKIPLLLVVVFLALDAEAVWLDLPPSGTKCVSEEIQPNVVVLADYFVIYEGHTHSAITIAIKQTPHIWHQLALYFWDELLSWSWRRPLGVPSPQVATEGINPMDFEQKVMTNVDNVIGRIKGIAPQCFSEEEEYITDPPQSVQRAITKELVHDGSNLAPLVLSIAEDSSIRSASL